MSYVFNQNDLNHFLIKDNGAYIMHFPKQMGYSKTTKSLINQDIILQKNYTHSNKNFNVKHNYKNMGGLYLIFLIEGNIEIKEHNHKISKSISKGNSLYLYEKGMNCDMGLREKSHFKSLNILINQNFLDKYLPNISFHEVKHLHVNPKIQSLAQEIYKSPFNGSLEELQIQSKTLDLIRLELLKLSLPEIKQKIMLTPYDTQALQKAKILLENEYKNPPSLEELSKKIHLNEFKLKNGFKSLFGIAPYTFSLKIRMQKAQELLKTGEYNVSEVAKEVGFPYVQNFTKAFIKEFGLRPKDVLKRSQIYI